MSEYDQREKHFPIMLCVGSAVQDVLLSGNVFTPHWEDGRWEEEFVVGEKYELEHVTFTTGGGATNAAVTFARQGLHAVYMGKIGKDPAANAILDDLHNEGVDTTFVKQTEDYHTSYSTILLAPNGGRTVLNYRGASGHFSKEDFDLANMQGDWLYISSLAGNLDVLEYLIKSARKKNIKIALNPGKGELKEADRLKSLIHDIDVLNLNKEEMQLLVEGANDEELVRHASDMSPTVVMTDGPRGVVATDRTKIVKAGMYEDVPVIDRLGAGDAFGSGLVAMLAQGKDLAEAIKFASANSTNVVTKIGAKAGILDKDVQLHDMPLEVTDF